MKGVIKKILNTVPRPRLQRIAHVLMPVAGIFYAGRRVECPVCGARFRKFMPYGYVKVRDGALCPRCLSLERHRLMWLYLSRETSFFSGGLRLLHIAPEHCFIKRFQRLLGEDYVTADIESPLAKVKMDIQDIPFDVGEFDVIFCNHILEHVTDDRLAMREMFRVMKPGGWGIMLSPVTKGKLHTYEDESITTPEGRLAAFGQSDHVREYGEDYAERLSQAGFEVEAVEYSGYFSREDAQRYGLSREKVYVVVKPSATT